MAEGSADELKRLVPGGHVELRLQDGTQAAAAAAALPEAVVDSETATLTIPTDGSIGSLGRILARLDDRTLSVERFALHTPDLDDVFFALTGSEKKEAVR